MSREIIVNAIDRNQLTGNGKFANSNLFIEAGAGAGKTRTIEERVLDQIIKGISPERFVVITFTNKATEEMRGRIVGAIKKAITLTEKYSKEEIEKLSIAYEKIHLMQISTIHSFCNRILNENSFLAQISFGAELLEEDGELNRQNQAFYDWKKTLTPSDYSKIDYDFNPENIKMFDQIKKTYDALCGQFDDVSYNDTIDVSFDQYFVLLENATNLLDEYYDLSKSKDLTLFDDAIKEVDLDVLRNSISSVEAKETIYKLIKLLKSGRNSFNKDKKIEPCIVDEAKAALKEVVGSAKELIIKLAHYPYRTINSYAIKAWEYYKQNRNRTSISNNQLIYETYKLLKDKPEALEKIANSFDTFYIDEFQDTDAYQINFVMQIAEAVNDRKQKDLLKDPNNEIAKTASIFIVGDPKQSIYRFRGADINTFSATSNKFDEHGANFSNIYFPDNFRSNNLIIDYVNDRYSDPDKNLGCEYKKMNSAKEHEINNPTGDEKLLGGVYSFNFNLDNKIQNIVWLIKYLKDNKFKIYQNDKNNKNNLYYVADEIKYSDFLIITCSKTNIAELSSALLNNGIPVNVQGNFSLGTSEILRANYRILSYLLNPSKDSKRLAGNVLKTFGVDSSKLEELKQNTKDMTAYGKMLYLFKNFAFDINNYSSCKQRVYNASVQQLFELIAVNEDDTDENLLLKLDDYVSTYRDSEIKFDEFDDAVRIMNVHKSKGLEGKIVIIPDSGGFVPDSGTILANGKLYLNNADIEIDPITGLMAKTVYDSEKEKEQTRLEYVDITRAEQVLIFEEQFKGNSAKLFKGEIFNNQDLIKYQLEHSEFPTINDVNEYRESFVDNSLLYQKLSMSSGNSVDKDLKEVTLLETSPSRLENKEIDVACVAFKKINRPVGNIFGDCLHRIMELYVLKGGTIAVDNLVKKVINEYKRDIDDVDKYVEYLTKCANSIAEHYQETDLFNKANSLKTEYKFVSQTIINERQTLLSGSIDLLVLNKDESATIIDYKSDIAGFIDNDSFRNKLKKSYYSELNAYREIVNKKFNIDVNNIHLHIIYLEEINDSEITHEFDLDN